LVYPLYHIQPSPGVFNFCSTATLFFLPSSVLSSLDGWNSGNLPSFSGPARCPPFTLFTLLLITQSLFLSFYQEIFPLLLPILIVGLLLEICSQKPTKGSLHRFDHVRFAGVSLCDSDCAISPPFLVRGFSNVGTSHFKDRVAKRSVTAMT